MNNFERLWKYKSYYNSENQKVPRGMPEIVVYAVVKEDVEMRVWNGHGHKLKNLPEFSNHMCKMGTKVRVWMVSRFGDCGITDNLENPYGYDARVDSEILKDLDFGEEETND